MKKLVSTLLVATTMIFSACNSSAGTTDQTTNSTSELTSETTAETSTTETTFDYKLNWMDEETQEFARYYEGNYHHSVWIDICYFDGFTDKINYSFTNFVNYKYNTNFESVPFSAAAYFRTHTIGGDRGDPQFYRDRYERFCKKYIEGFSLESLGGSKVGGVLTNKVVISYLYQNNIPFGKKVPLEKLQALQVKDIYDIASNQVEIWKWLGTIYKNDDGPDKQIKQHKIDSSTKYTNEELFKLLLMYNFDVNELCVYERILTLDFFSEDPKFKDASKDAIEAYNKHFDKYWNGKGLRLGEVPTLERFRYVYGDDPIDLSYIFGAVNPPIVIAYPDGSVAEVK